MKRKRIVALSLVLAGSFMAFLIGEGWVRLIGRSDIDGNFYVRSLRCYPYCLPLHKWTKGIETYRAFKNNCIQYDPVLGWVPRPHGESRSGNYRYNSDGIRSEITDSVVSDAPDPDVLRIAIFGDSFTHGDGVPFRETWGYFLEENLRSSGVNAEVLNFGVGGYGMDQALLRWRTGGSRYKPQIVIFGLQMENIGRNVNTARPVYFPRTGIPFFKPRFILENNELKLVNTPTPAPDEMMAVIRDFARWENLKYEHWYDTRYTERMVLKSRLIGFVWSFIDQKILRKDFVPLADAELLSLAIIRKFKEEVESTGAKFFVVFLPARWNLRIKSNHFLDEAKKISDIFNPQSALLEKAATQVELDVLIPAHYSAGANKIVADVCAVELIDKIEKFSKIK